ncbi:hypothetical protein P691DRAFT_784469 [Macrolepiota fuliginosa MF-IS2]|uniref:Uncharacterized protein n=1 Tax=Macrolepiota fuliginosa MF-IS2 TaxID=1400762 RepID=A0A9P5WWW8_9AGAR|nr:hypothetical protein P691DRAFT_784469 [Macrolepiota fuliginosa MF-IS2]
MRSQYIVASIGLNAFNNINPSLMGAEFVVLLVQALSEDHKMLLFTSPPNSSTLESNDPLSMVIDNDDLPSTSPAHLNFNAEAPVINQHTLGDLSRELSVMQLSITYPPKQVPAATPATDAGNPVQTSSPNMAEVPTVSNFKKKTTMECPHGTQVRTSGRQTKPPSVMGPLTQKDQPPQKKVPANQRFIWVDAPEETVNPSAPGLSASNNITPKPKAPHTKKGRKNK